MKKRWWVLGAAAILAPVALIKPGKRRDLTDFTGKTYAHRGLHGPGVPENSLPAFRRAVQKGVGVELDVQLTRDGVPVVFHDKTLLRMCGVDRRVCDLSYEELKAYPLAGSSEVIPTFRQVLDVLGKTPLICEIKTYRSHTDQTVCEKVKALLEEYPGVSCVESFNPLTVQWLKKHWPEKVRGQLSMNFARDPAGQNPVVGFCLTHLLINGLGRPDFIAYCHTDTDTVGFRLCRRLFHPAVFAWTTRGRTETERARKEFDAVIFEEKKQEP